MTGFADTSFLLALVVDDEHSTKAERWVRNHLEPLYATDLVVFETFNVLRSLRLREEEEKNGLLTLNTLLLRGSLIRRSIRTRLLTAESYRLVDHFSPRRPHGAMDVLHVAAARLLKIENFASFDDNQRALAEASGLHVVP